MPSNALMMDRRIREQKDRREKDILLLKLPVCITYLLYQLDVLKCRATLLAPPALSPTPSVLNEKVKAAPEHLGD